MKILITGPQGSGKTTQAKILSQKLNLCLVSAGDLVRDFAQKRGQRSSEVKEELRKGDLVEDDLVYDLVKSRLQRPDCANGFISDAYPRSEFQAEFFDPQFDKVIYLDIPDELAKKRLLERGRIDDTPQAINQRLYWYHKDTEPLVKKYQKQNKLIRIDGTQSIEQISKEIRESLGV